VLTVAPWRHSALAKETDRWNYKGICRGQELEKRKEELLDWAPRRPMNPFSLRGKPYTVKEVPQPQVRVAAGL